MNTIYGETGPPNPPRKVNFGWISESWRLFSSGKATWIASIIAVFALPVFVLLFFGSIIGGAGAMSRGHALRYPLWMSLGLPVFFLLYFAFFYGGLYRMGVMQVRGQIISIVDFFSGGRVFLRMLGLMVIYSVAVGIGLFLFVIPGLMIAALLLPSFALVADGIPVGAALSQSIKAMVRDLGSAIGLVFVFTLLYMLSALPCGLGLFVTVPMMFLLSALVYRDMIGIPNMVTPAGPTYGSPQSGVWPPPPSQ